MEQTALVVTSARAGEAPPLELVVAAWLAQKGARSGSARTLRAYRDGITSYRAALQATARCDLDGLALGGGAGGAAGGPADARVLALVAQRWAERPDPRPGRRGGPPAAVTANQRLAILSSFYAFALKRGLLPSLAANPMSALDRRPGQSYGGARALDFAQVSEALAAIDRATPAGARDYALLALALGTGRRLAEVAALCYRHLEVTGSSRAPTVTIHWPRAKGDKKLHDTLPGALSLALLAHVARMEGARSLEEARAALGQREGQRADAPLWRSLARNHSRGAALSHAALEAICQRRLGTSHFHALRHTFAHGMEQVGAQVSDIQARLGHANLATTGLYLAQLRAAENTHGDALAALLGITAAPKATVKQKKK